MSAPDVELVLRAEPESVALARQAIRGVGDCLSWLDGRADDVALAVTEACTNSVLHAYPDDDDGGDYAVRVWAGEAALTITVSDRGGGITPRVPSAKAGLGLGLPLMVAIGDEVSFSRHESGGTEVRLVFRREEEDPE